MREIAESPDGLLWLKVRAITRKQLMNGYCEIAHPHLIGQRLKDQSICLYTELLADIQKAHSNIDHYIKSMGATRTPQELEKIASELHKMQHFSWGGAIVMHWIGFWLTVISRHMIHMT